jgi:hypothetical protein
MMALQILRFPRTKSSAPCALTLTPALAPRQIALSRTGSHKTAISGPFFTIYGRVRLAKIFCLKRVLRLDPRYTSPYLGPTQVAYWRIDGPYSNPSHNVLPEA